MYRKRFVLLIIIVLVLTGCTKIDNNIDTIKSDVDITKDPFVVFRYEIDPISGYPCKIRYSSNLFSCKDETALIVTIKDVMKYRGLAISEKVRELVKNSNKEEKQ